MRVPERTSRLLTVVGTGGLFAVVAIVFYASGGCSGEGVTAASSWEIASAGIVGFIAGVIFAILGQFRLMRSRGRFVRWAISFSVAGFMFVAGSDVMSGHRVSIAEALLGAFLGGLIGLGIGAFYHAVEDAKP